MTRVRILGAYPATIAMRMAERSRLICWEPDSDVVVVRMDSGLREDCLRHAMLVAVNAARDVTGCRLDGLVAA